MFSKNGCSDGRPPRGWSLARRLALLHIGAVLLSYALFGGLFYAERTSQQQAADRNALLTEAEGVRAMLRQPNGAELFAEELRTQVYEPDDVRPFLRVVDRAGRVVRESPGMGEAIPRSAFAGENEDRKGAWRNARGDYYLIKSVRLDDNQLSGPGGVLQVGLSARAERAIGSQLRYALLSLLAGGMVFAFACAYVIVWLGLRPLEGISRVARSVTRRELHKRIDELSLPAELVPLAESFNSMLARLEDSFDRLAQYSGNLAHELRTPINTLMISADIALSRERTPEEYQKLIGASLEQYERLAETIDRLLFLAWADARETLMPDAALDLAREIDELLDYFSDSASEVGVALERSGDGRLAADQQLLRRALSNLIGNALAHTPPGGRIASAVRQGAERATELVVSDTGCGIEAAHLGRIFDRFFRVEGGRQGSGQGSGLGLAIVKAIMQMHGGSVALESALGEGTRVTLRFPPPQEQAASAL